jgi:hypothetical protein
LIAFLFFNCMEQHTPHRVPCSRILRLNNTSCKMFAGRFDNLRNFSTYFRCQSFFLYYSTVNHQKRSMDRIPSNSFYYDLKCFRFQVNNWCLLRNYNVSFIYSKLRIILIRSCKYWWYTSWSSCCCLSWFRFHDLIVCYTDTCISGRTVQHAVWYLLVRIVCIIIR